MKSVAVCAALAIGLSLASLADSADAAAGPAALAENLRTLARSVDDHREPVPNGWRVTTPDGTYSISSEPLRLFLVRHQNEAAKQWLQNLAAEVESYRSGGAPNLRAHSELQSILSRREFASNGPPGAWERLRARIGQAFENWFHSLLDTMRQHPTSSRVVFWLVALGAAAFLALWAIGISRRASKIFKLSYDPAPAGPHAWELQLNAARDAANSGDHSAAVERAYWAGVICLQASGALPGSNHTPREYVRLVSTPRVDRPLRTLTNYLERFWYGRGTASPADFAACIGCLEALGCKVD